MKNRIVEFMKGSTDFLRTLGHMSAIADEGDKKPVIIQRKEFIDMVSTIELFYDMADLMFRKYEEEIHLHRLEAINEHAKLIILTKDIKNLHNELYKVRSKMPPELMTAYINYLKKTALPTAEDFKEDVNLKQQRTPHGQETRPV